jgi:hypothetical protein
LKRILITRSSVVSSIPAVPYTAGASVKALQSKITIEIVEISGSHGWSMKITVFWNTAPCGMVDTDRCFEDAYCRHQGDD